MPHFRKSESTQAKNVNCIFYLDRDQLSKIVKPKTILPTLTHNIYRVPSQGEWFLLADSEIEILDTCHLEK